MEKDHDDIPPKPLFWLFLKSGGWGVFLAIVILAGSIMAGFLKSNMANNFERNGLISTATISQLYTRVERDSDGSKTVYYAKYDFDYIDVTYDYNGLPSDIVKTVSKRRSIGKKNYAKLKKGQAVQVRYLPEDPKEFESPIGQTKADAASALWVTIIVGSIALAFLWFCGLAGIRLYKASRQGRALNATITDIKRTGWSINDKPQFRLVWIDEMSGAGQSWLSSKRDLEKYKIGDKITIFLFKGKTYWRGDIGGRTIRKTSIPKSKTPN